MMEEGFFRIPNEVLRIKEFTKWLSSAEARVWITLSTKIVRQKCDNWLPNYVFENYYKNGKLATSWRLSALAHEMGYGDGFESHISKHIANLVKKKFIKKDVVVVKGSLTNIYVLGYVEKTDNVEILYTYIKFLEKQNTKKLSEFYEIDEAN